MNIRVHATLAAICTCALVALIAPAAQANLLSILPGSCGNQVDSHPFARWGDNNSYTLVTGLLGRGVGTAVTTKAVAVMPVMS